ncbi:MAG: hypothetical protein IIB46_02320 [Nitrospinae bacterium]|nr:hypothetical protein [Nitrospinota bacterium]
MKLFVGRFFLTGIFLLGVETPGFTEPCAPLQAFSNVVNFERLSNGQIISWHDCNRDGLADYQSIWTVVEFADGPLACRDPYDPRHLIVPRSGFYRILADPVRVVVMPEKKQAATELLRIPAFLTFFFAIIIASFHGSLNGWRMEPRENLRT